MENQLMTAVWIITILIFVVPMPLIYKIIGIIVSIILIALYTYIAYKNHRLNKITLIINLVVIGWDLAVVFGAVSGR
jgi:hypothetical protein